MSVRFEYSIKYPRIPHSPHPKPVSFRTFDTPVSRQDLCLSTMDDVSAGPRATEGPSPWHRRRVVGRESVGCFMIRCIFRAYGSGKWRRGTLFYTDPCVLFPERLWLRNAGFVDFLKPFRPVACSWYDPEENFLQLPIPSPFVRHAVTPRRDRHGQRC